MRGEPGDLTLRGLATKLGVGYHSQSSSRTLLTKAELIVAIMKHQLQAYSAGHLELQFLIFGLCSVCPQSWLVKSAASPKNPFGPLVF